MRTERFSAHRPLTSHNTRAQHDASTPAAAPTWSDLDRLAKQDAEHDIAMCVLDGREPRQDDIDKLRRLIAKRDAYLAAPLTPAAPQHLQDLEATGLREPLDAGHAVGDD